ncbi:nuclear receptor 2C2-associated protein isoform X1 [Thunnus maccoyii]|uniref:nuclear receptor 2C2-associated protein isoform X1 n=1 Tax=Thunnus maccoyii TaxID=8240 RepID=UPI001C4C09B3|nr:nuclear receptor 2C2-associated protein isoform X1 [Thunnus maccoyii]
MASSLICGETQSRVSSVLNRDVKQYGKKYMFDCNEETCWNSDQGECQWVTLEFPQAVRVSQLKVQFQGGFSSKTCRLEGYLKDGDFTVISDFYPEDNNSLQISFILTMQHLSEEIRLVTGDMSSKNETKLIKGFFFFFFFTFYDMGAKSENNKPFIFYYTTLFTVRNAINVIFTSLLCFKHS